jgi:hypothetical protein
MPSLSSVVVTVSCVWRLRFVGVGGMLGVLVVGGSCLSYFLHEPYCSELDLRELVSGPMQEYRQHVRRVARLQHPHFQPPRCNLQHLPDPHLSVMRSSGEGVWRGCVERVR